MQFVTFLSLMRPSSYSERQLWQWLYESNGMYFNILDTGAVTEVPCFSHAVIHSRFSTVETSHGIVLLAARSRRRV
jgi:hypothetical protein